MRSVQFSRQRGVVMITSLVLLVILTMLAVSMLRASIVDLKIGGANQLAAQNLANAEAEIMRYVNEENNGARNWVNPTASTNVTQYGDDTVQIIEIRNGGCTDAADTMMHSGLYEVYRGVRARATSVLGGEVVINQGVRATTVSCG